MVTNNTKAFKNAFNNVCKDALNEIGITGKADLMANCAVDTGVLRRGHNFKIEGIKVTFGNYVNYAPYVEFRAKGSRPWFRQTLQSDIDKFNNILKKHLKKVGV